MRDDCVAAGQPVSRAAVNFVLQGLGYAGFRSPTSSRPGNWLRRGRGTSRSCAGLRSWSFDDAEKLALRRWASGGLLEDRADES